VDVCHPGWMNIMLAEKIERLVLCKCRYARQRVTGG
jgi:hypothetical protein